MSADIEGDLASHQAKLVFDKEPVQKVRPLLSFIVPIYNTAPFLGQCLNSLIVRVRTAYEIILVHDGGHDDSLQIAVAWAQSVKVGIRVRILDQANQGLSATRHTGIAAAAGEFVAFLDSDDIADALVYTRASELAVEHRCDMVMFRSAVLDGATMSASLFYDAAVWEELLDGRSFLTTNVSREPSLFRLEPNANTRVIKRALFLQREVYFPIGLFFEDLLPHVQALCTAGRIGLMSEAGYLYRVNRPGKITDEQTRRRFDCLECVALANKTILGAGVSIEALANYVIQATRLIVWCGTNVPNRDRLEFCEKAIAVMSSIESPAAHMASQDYARDTDDRINATAFANTDLAALLMLTGQRSPAFHMRRYRQFA